MEHLLSRRELLKRSAQTLGAVTLVSRFGALSAMAQTAGSDYKALVCIFLNGGNDGFNMVAPNETATYADYLKARPTIALPQTGAGAMLSINSQTPAGLFGLHPNLTGLRDLYNANSMAVLCNVGTLTRPFTDKVDYKNSPSARPKSLFDHGIQTDTWQELGIDGGWGNGIGRVLQRQASTPAPIIPVLVNVTGGASVYLAGSAPYITLPPGSQGGTLSLQGFTGSASDNARMTALRNLYRIQHPDPVVRAISDRTDKAISDGQAASTALSAAAVTTVFPDTNLGRQLKQIAIMIKARGDLNANKRQVFFASLGGFDTHDSQIVTQQNLMTQLNGALSAFYAATKELSVSKNVTTFTLSEFGRTVQNSGDGSDHAWGSHAFIMGDAVDGGKFYGKYPSLVLGGADDVDTGTSARGRILPQVSSGSIRGDALPMVRPQRERDYGNPAQHQLLLPEDADLHAPVTDA